MTFGTDATSEGSSEVQPAGEAHPPLPADLYCPDCGYNLRGLTSRRCPECGLVLDFIESDTPIIPWERRRELGRFRAYWQTVLMVMFRNKLFCRAAYRSVSYRDAQKFRWVCILHVLIPLLLMLPILKVFDAEVLADAVENFGVWFIVVVYICALLALLALTGLPSYVFHPKSLSVEQQDRAVALSYYGFAAVSWSPLILITVVAACSTEPRAGRLDWGDALLGLLSTLGAVTVLVAVVLFLCGVLKRTATVALAAPAVALLLCLTLVASRVRPELDLLFALLTVLLPAALVLASWFDLVRVARRTLRQPWAVFRVAVLVPPLWLVVGGLTLVGLPAVAYFVALVFYSLRGSGSSG
ncbi:MAG TPA: hypothetical protein VM487_17650 [Phycisphaerae bacterium]|nr:hypothetical protein [Phycisphaerae bacterium]